MEALAPKYEQFEACLVLSAVGDAMGYMNGGWEFQKSGVIINKQMMEMTNGKGPLHLKIDMKWRYSDDTVMHIATAKALSKVKRDSPIQTIGKEIAIAYKKCWQRMSGRAPGKTTGKAIKILNADGSNWNKVPYMDRACGCGGAMRSACIGLYFPTIEKVIEVSVEAGRITHHNPIGYLGSVVSACFTFYAIHNQKPEVWAALLMNQVFPKAKEYVTKSGRELELNFGQHWTYFVKAWENYIKARSLSTDPKVPVQPTFPKPYGLMEREHFYKQVSYKGWGGSSGHDSVIIAYDAILGSKESWEELCYRAILHGGDNDSTGSIAGAWFGALYGYKNVPDNHKKEVQDVKSLKILAENLYKAP